MTFFPKSISYKFMQNQNMQMDIAESLVRATITFLTTYRETGFTEAIEVASKIANKLNVPCGFKLQRLKRKKRLFDYESGDEVIENPSDKFKIGFFNVLLACALNSLEERFTCLSRYSEIFE